MHERSLVRAMLEQVTRVASEHPGSEVAGIHVAVGELSGAEPSLVAATFEELADGTVAEGARFELDVMPVGGCCHRCGREVAPMATGFVCPYCGSSGVSMTSGDEFLLQSIDLVSDQVWTSTPVCRNLA